MGVDLQKFSGSLTCTISCTPLFYFLHVHVDPPLLLQGLSKNWLSHCPNFSTISYGRNTHVGVITNACLVLVFIYIYTCSVCTKCLNIVTQSVKSELFKLSVIGPELTEYCFYKGRGNPSKTYSCFSTMYQFYTFCKTDPCYSHVIVHAQAIHMPNQLYQGIHVY